MLQRTIMVLAALAGAARAAEEADPTKPPGAAGPEAARAGNDFRLKVLWKLDVSYQLDDASLTGQAPLALRRPELPGGDAQAAALAARADYLSSEHVLGTEGLGWKHLRLYYNGYLLHRFDDGPSSVFPTAYLRGEQTAYDVRAGYAEIDGFRDAGFWSHAFLRVGRQFRYGAGVATFDGLTAGYNGRGVEVSVWGGRRSPRFLDDADPGFVAGADVVMHLDALARVPVDLSADYLVYAARPTNGADFQVRHVAAFTARWRMRSGGRLLASLSTFDFEGLRAYVAYTQPLGRPAQLKLDYDLKLGRDAVYDWVAGFGLAPSRYFALPDTEPRSRFGLRVDHAVGRHFEYALFATFNIVHGDGDVQDAGGWTGPTAFDATYEEMGAIARVNGGFGITPEAEYRVRLVQRADEKGRFSDTAAAGEHQFQEVRGDLRVRPARGLSFLVGVVYRVYDYVTRYAPTGADTTVANDGRVAGSGSVEVLIKQYVSLRARYEIAQDSRTFAPELDLVQRFVATAGGRF
jgi:hypothetical protein